MDSAERASGIPNGAVEEIIVWEPQPGPQTALVQCPVFEVFYGGARGGGKTDGALGDWLSHADLYGKRAIGLMVRRELKQLLETIERSKEIFTPLGASYNETEKMWRMPNGARLRFAYLERDADADAYQGHGYTRVYVEEIGNFPDPRPIFKLMATLRSGSGVPCGFRATGNPGGPGHSWVKARYIDPAPLGWKIIGEAFENPWTHETLIRERVFIPADLRDNKYLGTDYIANLQMSGSPQLVEAWLKGDWNVIAGAFFPEFSTARHVVRPFTIPEHWTRFRAMDWGSVKPFSVGWYAVASDDMRLGERLVLPRGGLVRYREWYGASGPNVGLQLPNEDIGRGIKQRDATEPEGASVTYGVLDPACFATQGGPSIAEQMKVPFRPADNTRISQRGFAAGWSLIRSRLVGEAPDRPMIVFFDTCTDLIRTLPMLQHDTSRPEDADSDGEDHAADELRYGCASRPWARPTPPPKEPLAGIERVTMNEMWKKGRVGSVAGRV